MLDPFPETNWSSPFCPSEPSWQIDWTNILENADWLKTPHLQKPNQDTLVWTKQICERLVTFSFWKNLNPQNRSILFLAALLHPVVNQNLEESSLFGQNFSYRYFHKTAKLIRPILWKMAIPFHCREMIIALTSYYSMPFCIFEKVSPEFAIIQASQTTKLDWLSILCQAQIESCELLNKNELMDKLELFKEFAKEQECFEHPRQFSSPHSRFIYFQKGEDPNYQAYDDTCLEVTLMCGVPASGKDTWIKNNLPSWPVISLDEIRKKLNIPANKNQGEVIRMSKEQARSFLRNKKDFVWNATNTLYSRRSQLISLFTSYQARVKIVYLETAFEEIFKRNHNRDETVPRLVIEKMLENLEIPDITEAHQVEWIIN